MKQIFIITGIALFLASCSKFEDINTNPNATQKVTSAMLATNLILDVLKPATGKSFVADPESLVKTVVWGESGTNYQYNLFGRTSLEYSVLSNVPKMIEAAGEADKPAYTGLGYFVKAYILFYNSMAVGDIPYSEALKGEEGNITPKYDSQKDVMLYVLEDLRSASESFAAASNFAGDPTAYGGSAALWRRAVNAFRLKVLMHLSLKASDPDLQVKQRFAAILNGEPLMETNEHNFQLVFSDRANQNYPFNRNIHTFIEYPIITSFLLDSLKKMNDYRLFYYANPAKYQIEVAHLTADDWDAYPGVDVADVYANVKALWSANKTCLLNLRYTDYIPGEPVFKISFAEQNFIIAEAIARGWVGGDAKAYYDAGIQAAMHFVADHTPDDPRFHHNRKITDTYIQSYINGTYVKFSSNQASQIHQILQQKYFMRFLQDPYESYYEYRRTGYPNWPVNPATNQNSIKDKVPVRWMYPLSEYDKNETHVQEAVQRQFGGQDDPNQLMWILQ